MDIYRRVRIGLIGLFGAPLVWVPCLFSLVVIFTWWMSLPSRLFLEPYSHVLVDRDGELLTATIAEDQQWRFPPPDRLPDRFVKALIVFEDKRFYYHPGVDPLAIAAALRTNIRAGEVRRGGSTITMQVIRLARKGRPRVLREKIIEALLAVRLELTHSKAEILRMFAAHAPFGGNVVGLEAAAWRYFGRAPDHLSWAEAALLVVLPNNPALIHPGRNQTLLKQKRDQLLSRLQQAGYIDESILELSLAEPVPEAPGPLPQHATHLLDYLKTFRQSEGSPRRRGRRSADQEPERFTSSQGYRLVSTVNRSLQVKAEIVMEKHAERLNGFGIENAAALILDVRSGEVLAYIGNVRRESAPGGFVDIVQSRRSTGSLLKPFLYAALLETGEVLPRQLIPDIPTTIGGYRPQNHTERFLGAVEADEVMISSLNVPAARMLQTFGVARFYSLLKSLGMTTLHRKPEEYGIPLILGGAEGSLWELTAIYGGMAHSVVGKSGQSVFIPRVTLPEGQADDHKQRVPTGPVAPVSPASWWITLKALQELERPYEEGSWRLFTGSKRIAWKTGTSFGYRDAWAIGVTPGYAVGVWAGNADGEGRPELKGSLIAGAILFDLFNLLEYSGDFIEPYGLRAVTVCANSGYLAGPFCPPQTELVPENSRLGTVCPYHQLVHLDPSGMWQVDSSVEELSRIQTESWFVLPPSMEWYYKQHHSDYTPLPPVHPRMAAQSAQGSFNDHRFSLLFPEPRSSIYVPVDLDGMSEAVICEAFHREQDAVLYWHLDGDFIAMTEGIHQIELQPSFGPHDLVVMDDTGVIVRRSFNVLSARR